MVEFDHVPNLIPFLCGHTAWWNFTACFPVLWVSSKNDPPSSLSSHHCNADKGRDPGSHVLRDLTQDEENLDPWISSQKEQPQWGTSMTYILRWGINCYLVAATKMIIVYITQLPHVISSTYILFFLSFFQNITPHIQSKLS